MNTCKSHVEKNISSNERPWVWVLLAAIAEFEKSKDDYESIKSM
jgi:hypothetical protein